jgi:hypothetical protein
MERRLLSAVAILWGLTGAGYLVWCDHRVSMPVLMRDTAWPRPFPYPDDWLKRWSDRIDAEYPLPLRYMRWGGFGELQGRVRAWTISALFAAAIGVAILLWTRDGRRRSRWPSVRRGVAIGLLVGLAWATALGHAERERLSSVWSAFFLWGFVFAFTGAVVGAVRSYPELVGLIVSPLAASLVRHSSTAGTGISPFVEIIRRSWTSSCGRWRAHREG